MSSKWEYSQSFYVHVNAGDFLSHFQETDLMSEGKKVLIGIIYTDGEDCCVNHFVFLGPSGLL